MIDTDNMIIHFDNSSDAKESPELNSYLMVINFPLGKLRQQIFPDVRFSQLHLS